MPMNRIIQSIILIALITGCRMKENPERIDKGKPGMKLIPGGEFIMGGDDPNAGPQEKPLHPVVVNGFYIDETEVTNQQFKEFVDATGYKTVAEKAPDWEELKKQLPPGTPKPETDLVAGSLVFVQPAETVISVNDFSQWWQWMDGADWLHPEGPQGNIENRWNHPVVHISHEDAAAYCQWAGKRLPSEAEWEYASRGGAEDEMYSWGNEFSPDGRFMANTFQGAFPNRNSMDDGFYSTAPVKSFPPNRHGLYDMIGNVWEWTNDLYDINYYAGLAKQGKTFNPFGSRTSYDPSEPFARKYVTKGGSFLCSSNYCVNYRSSARQASAFDTGASNVGFRCAKDQ